MAYLGRIRTGWDKNSPFTKGLVLTVSVTVVLIASFLAIKIAHVYERNKNYDISYLRAIPIEEVINKVKSSETERYERIYPADQGYDYPEEIPIDWDWQIDRNRTHNFYLHSWDNLNRDLIAFDKEKDPYLLEDAISVVNDWIRSNEVEYVNNQDGNFAWYDMAVGVRTYRLAYILDQSIRAGIASDNELELMWESLLDHIGYLQNEENIIFHNNHGIFQASGQKAAARRFLAVDKKQFGRISNESSTRLAQMLNKQFTNEGVHKEHSPGYHERIYQVFLQIKKEGLLDNNESSGLITKAGDVLYWMIKPNGFLVNFGDTDFRYISRNPERFYDEAASYLTNYVSNGSNGSLPSNKLACFKESGLVVIKHRSSYLAQQAAFHSRTHKHADDLTIAWYNKGQDILIDSGKYGYPERTKPGSDLYNEGFWYSDPKRIYVEKTRAHNTVEIDDSDQNRVDREPYGSAIKQCGQTENGIYFIESEVEQSGGMTHSRLLFFKPEEWLVVADRLSPSDSDEHNYKQWFHFAEDLNISRSDDGFVASGIALEEELYITNLLGTNDKATGPIASQIEPSLQGWYSPFTNVLEPSPAIAFDKQQSGIATFATLMAFSDGDIRVLGDNSFNNNGGNFSWEENGKAHSLGYSLTGNGEIKVEFSEQ